jgi:transposase
MPKTRAPYAPEFRRQMVDLVRAGRDPDDLAREFEPTAQSIRNWVAAAGANVWPAPSASSFFDPI